MRPSSRSGFTLIELLTVVATMAVLAGILYPVFARARETARRTSCLSNLHQLAAAHHLYVQDYDGVLPAWYQPGANGLIPWTVFFRPYYGDPRILHQGFVPPSEMIQPPCSADYAMLTWGPGGDGTVYSPHSRWPGSVWNQGEPERPMRLDEVRRPADTALFADGLTCIDATAIYSQHQNYALMVAFVDGHARRVTRAEWWQIDRDERGYFRHLGAADR